MSDAALVPVERGAAERLAFTCCVKERPRARRRLRRRAAQTKKSADRDASTPGFQNKSTQHQLGAFALCPVTNTVGFITRYCARSVDLFCLPTMTQFAVSGQIIRSETEGCCDGFADDCAAVREIYANP